MKINIMIITVVKDIRVYILLPVVIAFTLLIAFSQSVRAAEARHVLVLHSYHPEMSWVSNIEKGIKKTLLIPPFDDLILHTEYMDTKRIRSDEHYSNLVRLFKEKYKNVKISLILSSDNNAFDFLLKNRDMLFPEVPVVFCGVNDFADESLEGVENFTGVAGIISSQESVEAILKQLPDTKEIFIINDYLKTGRAWQATISRKLAPFKDQVKITFNENMSIRELRDKIMSLKSGSVVLLGVYYSDRDGKYFTFEKLGSILTSDSPVPVYCLLKFNIRDGVIGGKVVSGYHQGVMMSDMARRILSGETDIPVAKVGANAFIFDWESIKKNNIPVSKLPPESIIINRPFSFYQKYSWLVLSTIFIFIAMSALMFVLLKNITKLKLMREKLSHSELKYRSIFNNATEGIFQTTLKGKMLAANLSFAKMFGYNSPEEVMDSVTTVKDDLYVFPGDRDRMFQLLEREGKVFGFEAEMKRKDGTKLWGYLNAYKTRNHDGLIVIEGSMLNITERKQAKDELIKAKEKAEKANKALRLSMAHLRTLLETMPELVWLKDLDGIYVFCNHRFERFFGASESEIIGKSDYDFVSKELADFFAGKDKAAIDSGGPSFNEETVIYKDDGHIEALETIKTPMFDDDGKVVGVLGVARDITQRKLVEKELNSLRNYLFNIINSMPSILVGVDKEYRISLWNKTAEESTGITSESAQGKLLIDVLPRVESVMGSIAESIKSRKPKREQRMPFKAEDGLRYEDITIYPIITDVVEGAVVRIDDVTERISLEQMMVQSEKMMSVGGLAAGMAHEINNPLAAIIGSAQNLKNRLTRNTEKNLKIAEKCGSSFEGIKKYVEERGCLRTLQGIHEAGLRAASIMQDMLSFSRKSEKQLLPYNPVDLMERSLNLAANDYNLKKDYDFRKIEIIREYDQDVVEVRCAGNEIQQVLLNLLKNGAEAMAEKEYVDETPTFTLRVHQADSMVILEVEDNGPGIDESIRKRILEPFYTTKPVGSGTGLGLSVSYFIVTDLHNGSMEVFSESGKWTRFVLKLPVSGGEPQDSE
ncbi:PAS domain-containing sensor histidine kinase [Maridesulfovibrio hydrothermalis]|uniref:histidine kinase n=1 Tax=Maridesulfovibrio hydrothermalis AM13 = DSM 14728 TaxID=1121451 RepID=L0REE2_9BACT|nr:PAS domain-containing sensor histidine kinase [Maridesulfovibrio hydrothermalis]CCO25134.1 putative Histidine kinase [Maridesulfovibrio hydrothermalis AM13 = DSM 14728]